MRRSTPAAYCRYSKVKVFGRVSGFLTRDLGDSITRPPRSEALGLCLPAWTGRPSHPAVVCEGCIATIATGPSPHRFLLTVSHLKVRRRSPYSVARREVGPCHASSTPFRCGASSSILYSHIFPASRVHHDAFEIMAEQRQPRFLKESAENCAERLQQLKQEADNRLRSTRNTSKSKKKLLSGVLQDVNDSLRSLHAWIVEFSKGDQTDNSQVIGTTTELFNNLLQSVEVAHDALNSRLRFRRLYLRGFVVHKKLRSPLSHCAASDKWLGKVSSIFSASPCKM